MKRIVGNGEYVKEQGREERERKERQRKKEWFE